MTCVLKAAALIGRISGDDGTSCRWLLNDLMAGVEPVLGLTSEHERDLCEGARIWADGPVQRQPVCRP